MAWVHFCSLYSTFQIIVILSVISSNQIMVILFKLAKSSVIVLIWLTVTTSVIQFSERTFDPIFCAISIRYLIASSIVGARRSSVFLD